MTSTSKRTYRSPAVERAFEVLSVLARTRRYASLSELARATEVPPSSLLGVLRSLETMNVVRSTSDKLYGLDVGLLELARAYVDSSRLIKLFTPVGRQLAARHNETVELCVLAGPDTVNVARYDVARSTAPAQPASRTLPAYATAAGKSLLAWVDAVRLRQLLGHEPFAALTPHTLKDYGSLERQLAAVRSRRYAESWEECAPGQYRVAAPVFDDASGDAVASVALTMPTARLTHDLRDAVRRDVMAAADQLSGSLSGSPSLLQPTRVRNSTRRHATPAP